MDAVHVIAVAGAHAGERSRYAERLARLTGRTYFAADDLAGSPDPAQEAAVRSSWADPGVGAVIELPHEVPAPDLIGAFADQDDRVRLVGLVCVVDVMRLLDDLHQADHLPLRDAESGIAAQLTARALLTVMQLEYASTIVLMRWEPLSPADLATTMALVSHLSPTARLRLHPPASEHAAGGDPYAPEQTRPGWVHVLNEEFDPHMTDSRVSASRYEQVRPLHPERLLGVLDRIEAGEFGVLVRSAGFCRLATRSHITAGWEQVGCTFSLVPLDDAGRSAEGELLAIGQDLALIGMDLDHGAVAVALDDAALTDAELSAGPAAWEGFADPFPIWRRAADPAD